jgi:Skp family chaperone for outer membrane proteins
MRYTSNIILIFLLLVILISGEDSKEQISADLQAKIEKYQKDLQTLQTQVGEVKAELEKVKGTTSFSLATAQEGIAN